MGMSHRVETIRRITEDGVCVEVRPATDDPGMVFLSAREPHPGCDYHMIMSPGFAKAVADAIYDRITEIEMDEEDGE
jgi:ABC-type Zn uptake system ZnuABC Zn-binding protein ZnuA